MHKYSHINLFYFRKFASPQANAWEHPYSQNLFDTHKESMLDKEGRSTVLYYNKKDKDYKNPKTRKLTGYGGVRITPEVEKFLRSKGYTGEFKEGVDLGKDFSNRMMDNYLHNSLKSFYSKVPNFGKLSDKNQALILDFDHNTGAYNAWPDFTKALNEGNMENIVKEMVDSYAYRSGPSKLRLRGIVDHLARGNGLKGYFDPNYNAYYVQRGDNLASIAKRLGVTEKYLIQHNNWINKNGKNLGIGNPIFTPIKNNAVVPKNSPTSFSSQKYWTPRPGDTLWKYYKGNQKLINDFYIRNKLKQGSAIKAGTPYLI